MLGRTRDELCPVAAILQWIVHRGSAPGPLLQELYLLDPHLWQT